MEETKVILGWIVDTRSLKISLPMDKYKRWITDIERLLSSPKVRFKHLETTIGRLNHVTSIYSTMRHFMGHIYQAQFRSSKSGWTTLSYNEKMDLLTLIAFLHSASKGISMNILAFRKP